MTQPNTLELAKQGDTQAIASLINRHLQPKGITATVVLGDACLQVMLESAQVMNQQALITFVRKGITGLDAAFIERVEVYAYQTGDEFPVWSQEFNLGVTKAELEAVINEQPSNNPQNLTISINLSGDTVRGLTTQNFEILANKMTSDIFSSCKDMFIQKVSISNGKSVITIER
ncbi:hypothetical protein [aff. Roholtiella sp. LEGE 12411]|uniref:hypothetical protein n=1 Tax=aff. Roholtiella sp. LEGE 12411 TaxID=1828822 RepID=UPI00187DEC83|nr:hypothetical protein [aff. Roholtiella sp. LEGE 12411]MBE9038039.1 hypothetical protein [aff. Roholtiella sp. LEGE 12411]